MTVRMLDAVASDFQAMDARALRQSIAAAEGRTLAVEVICTAGSLIDGVSLGEIGAAMGADLIALDGYDGLNPVIVGAPEPILKDPAPLAAYSALLGRPVAINMIVAAPESSRSLVGRLVSDESVERVIDQGADLIYLYVRPKQGGTPGMQQQAAQRIKARHGNRVMLVGVPSFSNPPPRDASGMARFEAEIKALCDAGCEGIGLPMPGSKQGWLFDRAAALIDHVHGRNALAWLFVTGSIESASPDTLAQLAISGKQLGADAFRLDEAGLSGMPLPENILAFSIALRGKRHTYRRMAVSIRR